jgi:hypothetical protein
MRRRPSLNPRRTDSTHDDLLKVNRLQFGRIIAQDTFSVEWERVGREQDGFIVLRSTERDGAKTVVKMWSTGHQKRDPICVTFDVSLFTLLYG